MLNIALLGEARTGKDSAADYLAERYGFVKCGISYPTKRAIGRRIADWTGDQRDPLRVCNDWKDRPDNHVRPILQLMADVLVEVADPATIIADIIVRQQLSGLPLVVADARMPWETQTFMDNGWVVIRMHRDPALRGAQVQAHARTEGLQAQCPFTDAVTNNGTIYDLHRALDQVLYFYKDLYQPFPEPQGLLGPAIRDGQLAYLGEYPYTLNTGPVGLKGAA